MAINPTGKIIRIGIIQGGRVIEERSFRKRGTITVGDGPKATFIIPSDKPIPKNFPIFADRKTHYELNFTSDMTGKLTALGDEPIDLASLAKSGKVQAKNNIFSLPLTEKMRGKVTVGDATMIFHFVAAPPLPAKPKMPAAIRGGLLKSIDWLYSGVMVGSILFHSALFVYASTQPIAEKSLEDLVPTAVKERVVTQKAEFKKQEAKDTKVGNKDEAKPDASAKEAPKDTAKGDPGPAKSEKKQMSAEDLAKAAAQRKQEIANKVGATGLLGFLTARSATGQNSNTAVADVLGKGGKFNDIGDTMDGVKNLGLATEAGERGRRGSGGGGPETKEVAGIPSDAGGGGGGGTDTQLAAPKEKEVTGTVTSTAATVVEGKALTQDAIRRVVNRNKGTIEQCYNNELKRTPNLRGRLVVEVTINKSGTVGGAQLVSATLSSAPVQQCVLRAVRSWMFSPAPGEEVIFSYPFIFEPSK